VEIGFNIFVVCTLSAHAYRGKGGVWLYLLLNFVRLLLILTLSGDERIPNTIYIELLQTFLVLIMVSIFVFSIGIGTFSILL
jgi:hypothetical protein